MHRNVSDRSLSVRDSNDSIFKWLFAVSNFLPIIYFISLSNFLITFKPYSHHILFSFLFHLMRFCFEFRNSILQPTINYYLFLNRQYIFRNQSQKASISNSICLKINCIVLGINCILFQHLKVICLKIQDIFEINCNYCKRNCIFLGIYYSFLNFNRIGLK